MGSDSKPCNYFYWGKIPILYNYPTFTLNSQISLIPLHRDLFVSLCFSVSRQLTSVSLKNAIRQNKSKPNGRNKKILDSAASAPFAPFLDYFFVPLSCIRN